MENIDKIPAEKHPLRKFCFPVIIVITCFLLYGNSIPHEYVFDDYIYTFSNAYIIKGFSAIKDIFDKGSLYGVNKDMSSQYRPLALLNFMAEKAIFGFNPEVSHFFNVLFFTITVLLLYFFLQKILGNYGNAVIMAATLLFAFHPIHTEVIDSIKNRDEILGLLFGLISFYFLIAPARLVSIAAFLFAVFCKEDCLSFILIIPLLLYFFTPLNNKKILIKTLPYLAVAVFYLFIRSRVLASMTFTQQVPVWSNSLMAAANRAGMFATSFALLGKYIYMTFIPYPLSWDYSYNQIPIIGLPNWKFIFTLFAVLILAGYALFTLKKKSIYSFLIAFFFITLFLSSNLVVKIAWTFGERFLYTPSIAFCIALPVWLSGMLKLNKEDNSLKNNKIYYGIITAILIIYGCIVIPRNNIWKNNFTLYESGIKTAPDSYRPYRCLGMLYMMTDSIKSKPELKFAEEELKQSLNIYKRDDAYYYLGVCYDKEGYADSAVNIYKNVMILNNEYSMKAAYNLAFIYNEEGIHYAVKGDLSDAFEEFKAAVACDSNFANAIGNIGMYYEKTGNTELARAYFQKALNKNPGNKVFAMDLQKLNQ